MALRTLVRKMKNLIVGCLRTALTYGKPFPNNLLLPDIGDTFSVEEEARLQTSAAALDTTYNGFVSSLELFIALVTVSSVTTVASYMSPRFTDMTTAQLVLIVFMIVGLFAMFTFCFFRGVLTTDGRNRRDGDVLLKDRLNLIGIILFYVFACVLDMFYSLALLGCDAHWRVCPSDVFRYYAVASLFHVTRVVYLGAETLFCIVFHNVIFADRCATRYGLMVLQAVNVALWLEVLLHESENRLETQKTFNFSEQCGAEGDNRNATYPTEATECFLQKTPIYNLLQEYICPNFYPFSIEFSILVGDVLGSWFVQSGQTEPREEQEDDDAGEDHQRRSGIIDGLISDGENSMSFELSRSSSHQWTVQREEEAKETDPLLRSGESSIGMVSRQESNSVGAKIFLLISLVVNLLFCILSLLPKFLKDEDQLKPYKRIYFIYGIAYFLMLLLLIALGYGLSVGFRQKKWRPLIGIDYLLLVSSVGPFAYEFFSFVAIANLGRTLGSETFAERFTITPLAFAVLESIHTLEIYFQIPFQLYVSRVDLRSDGSPASQSRRVYFKAVLFHFAVSNIGLWAVNSFNGNFNVTKVFLQSEYFGKETWLVANNIVLPLTLFFRFTSFLHFTRAYSSAL